MCKQFQLGQIVKENCGAIAHYAIVLAENRTVGWVNNSTLEVKPIEGIAWESVDIYGEYLDFQAIKDNIRSFKTALDAGEARTYHLTEFNCEHWATLMATGQACSSQSGAAKIGAVEIAGGAMVVGGASAGTVVTVASTLGAAASTGTAISSLSGAAATNAALAWLGGGTIASGGGGIAAGTAIISSVATGGAVIAIAGVGIITKKVWDNLNESQRQAVVKKLESTTPDQIKVAYNVSVDKLGEAFDFTNGWMGDRSSELAKIIDQATPPEVKEALANVLDVGMEIGKKTIATVQTSASFLVSQAQRAITDRWVNASPSRE